MRTDNIACRRIQLKAKRKNLWDEMMELDAAGAARDYLNFAFSHPNIERIEEIDRELATIASPADSG